jgi:hypothetical protein
LLCIETCDEEEKEAVVSLGAGSSIFCLLQGECFSKNQMQEQEDCEQNQCVAGLELITFSFTKTCSGRWRQRYEESTGSSTLEVLFLLLTLILQIKSSSCIDCMKQSMK